jgi:hypothetical protein
MRSRRARLQNPHVMRRLRVASAREIDVMLAGALFVAGCLELASGLAGAPPVVQFLALPLQTLTLSQRRAHPVWVIGIVLLGLALPAVFGVPQNASVIPLIGYVVAVYSASAERPWPRSGVGLAVAAVGVSGVIALGPKHDASDLLFGIVVTGVAFGAWARPARVDRAESAPGGGTRGAGSSSRCRGADAHGGSCTTCWRMRSVSWWCTPRRPEQCSSNGRRLLAKRSKRSSRPVARYSMKCIGWSDCYAPVTRQVCTAGSPGSARPAAGAASLDRDA